MQIYINNVLSTTEVVKGSVTIRQRTDGQRDASISFYDVLPNANDGDELEIFDGATKLFGGIIKSFNVRYFTPLTDSFPVLTVDLTSDGYDYIASRKIINISRTNVNVTTIVNDCMGTLSAEGVVAGTITSGPTVSYTQNYVTVKKVLDDMADIAGYVWYIDNSRRLQFVPQQTVTNAFQELKLNGVFKDFHNLSWSGSVENYANKVWVLYGASAVLVKENTAEITARSLEADGVGSGVYGYVTKDSNIITSAQADDVADAHLNKYAIPQGKLSFSSYTKGWAPGTKLKVSIPQITGFSTIPPFNPNEWYYLIEDVTIDVEDARTTRYTMNCTRRIDGANFSTQRSAGFEDYFKKMSKNWY